MNILFLIFSHGKASGGHYHSLDQISREVGLDHKVNIVTIGPNESPLLINNPYFTEHLIFNQWTDLFRLYKKIGKIDQVNKFDSIHFFDTESLNLLWFFRNFFDRPFILNKCGGPNPLRKKWQKADFMVLFSLENYKWFEKSSFYNSDSLFLIPNRVQSISFNEKEEKRIKKDREKINFLRISRLGGAYDHTLRITFKMIKSLSADYNVKLFVIGRVQDQKIYENHTEHAKELEIDVQFITDSNASNAKQFLYLADFVVGTGRSFMEASSLGIPTLAPSLNLDWPVLVSKNNFDDFFEYNFSERSTSRVSSEENKKRIKECLESNDFYENLSKETIELFKLNFDTSGIRNKYDEVYKAASDFKNKGRLRLIFWNLPYIIMMLFNQQWRKKN